LSANWQVTAVVAVTDALAERLAVRVAEAVALRDREGDDERDAVADAVAPTGRLGEREALRETVREALFERVMEAETDALRVAVLETYPRAWQHVSMLEVQASSSSGHEGLGLTLTQSCGEFRLSGSIAGHRLA
jgi:hypothetical protein